PSNHVVVEVELATKRITGAENVALKASGMTRVTAARTCGNIRRLPGVEQQRLVVDDEILIVRNAAAGNRVDGRTDTENAVSDFVDRGFTSDLRGHRLGSLSGQPHAERH